MKKALVAFAVLVIAGGAGYAYYRYRETPVPFTVNTAPVSRGDIVDTVGATGTLQAVTTVQVGTQVSGTIDSLGADFNSLVRKGQVLARLDPSLFQTQIEQARANLARAQADLERLRVAVDDAQQKAARARELSSRSLLPKSDLDASEVAVRSAQAQVQSAEAQVTQARASLNQNDVNLQHTVIEAPIDGLVISRNVDVGQTVAASMQAPTLFVLAADLTKMQVVANLDESDVGRIRPGQNVSFRVDAYPTENFTGKVSQVRLEPKTQQNVVTYATVIDVPNDKLELKPGMTANVTIEIARRTDVVRVPNSALRFRPTADTYAALGLTPPEPGARGDGANGGAGRRGGQAAGAAQAAPAPEPAGAVPPAADVKPQAAGGRGTPPAAQQAARGTQPPLTAQNDVESGAGVTEGRRGGTGRGGAAAGGAQAGGRFQNMTAEERQQFRERLRAQQNSGASADQGGTAARGRGAAPTVTPAPASSPATRRSGGATTIDALFGPLAVIETVGRAWIYEDKQLKPVRLRLGITDGQNTELVEGNLQPGVPLVTSVTTPTATTRPATAFPFGGQPGRGAFPGGGFQGGGGGGNRGNAGRG